MDIKGQLYKSYPLILPPLPLACEGISLRLPPPARYTASRMETPILDTLLYCVAYSVSEPRGGVEMAPRSCSKLFYHPYSGIRQSGLSKINRSVQ
jgi:hypothetical protein